MKSLDIKKLTIQPLRKDELKKINGGGEIVVLATTIILAILAGTTGGLVGGGGVSLFARLFSKK